MKFVNQGQGRNRKNYLKTIQEVKYLKIFFLHESEFGKAQKFFVSLFTKIVKGRKDYLERLTVFLHFTKQ